MICMRSNVGEPIFLWRRRMGWTQEEVAARLDVQRERYAKWERGEVMPPLEYRIKLAELGLSGLPGVTAGMAVFEQRAPYPSTTPGQLRILIDTLADCETPATRKEAARDELYRVLDLEEKE